MTAQVESYLAMRRATGFTLSNTEYLLRSFAGFAADRKQQHVRTATAIEWAALATSVAQRHTRYQTVCRFARYLRVEDSRHEAPPENHFGFRKTRRVPHIYSREEINRLILAATNLPPSDSPKSRTYTALIGLLAATGMRISEALHLLVSDVTPNGLLIRKTKFQKTRLVPLHDTAVAGLGRYLMYRQEARCGGDHLFVSEEGRALVNWFTACFAICWNRRASSPPTEDGHESMTSATRLQFEPWSPHQQAGNESGNTCWPWRPT